MIRNEHERRVTQRKLTELTNAVEANNREPMPDGRDPEMHQLVIDGFHTQIAELQAELDAYAELAAGNVDVELPDLYTIGEILVRARIAAGLSQRALDEAAGLAEGVTRRYERENYNGASLHRLQLVQHTLHTAMMDPTNTTAAERNAEANARNADGNSQGAGKVDEEITIARPSDEALHTVAPGDTL